MTRREVLSRTSEGDGHIELFPADHEEPTWELRRPRRRRLDRRTRTILIAAAAAAVVVNAGAAWMYWQITESGNHQAAAGTSIQLAVRARSDLNNPLKPGTTGNLTVTVTNDSDVPIRINAVTPDAGPIVADELHREAGCQRTGVAMTEKRFDVSWEIPRNTIGAFTIPAALVMTRDADATCAGAVYTVPVQAGGFRLSGR